MSFQLSVILQLSRTIPKIPHLARIFVLPSSIAPDLWTYNQ